MLRVYTVFKYKMVFVMVFASLALVGMETDEGDVEDVTRRLGCLGLQREENLSKKILNEHALDSEFKRVNRIILKDRKNLKKRFNRITRELIRPINYKTLLNFQCYCGENARFDYDDVLFWELFCYGTTSYDNTELIKFIVDNGVDPASEYEKSTCLHFALCNSRYKIVKILFTYFGINVNVKDDNGKPAIFDLAVFGYEKTGDEKVKLFKELFDKHNANSNIMDNKGNNVLMELFKTRSFFSRTDGRSRIFTTDGCKIAECLIGCGIDLNAKNSAGKTAFYYLEDKIDALNDKKNMTEEEKTIRKKLIEISKTILSV